MSQFQQLVRLRTWELDEKRREIGVLLDEEAALQAQKSGMQSELELEKQAAAGSIEARQTLEAYMIHYRQRMAALVQTIEAKQAEVAAKNEEVLDAYQELRKAEAVLEEHETREAQRLDRLEQVEIDEIALNMTKQRRY